MSTADQASQPTGEQSTQAMYEDLALDVLPREVDVEKIRAAWDKRDTEIEAWRECNAWVKGRVDVEVEVTRREKEVSVVEVRLARLKIDVAHKEHEQAVANEQGQGSNSELINLIEDQLKTLSDDEIALEAEIAEARRKIEEFDERGRYGRWSNVSSSDEWQAFREYMIVFDLPYRGSATNSCFVVRSHAE